MTSLRSVNKIICELNKNSSTIYWYLIVSDVQEKMFPEFVIIMVKNCSSQFNGSSSKTRVQAIAWSNTGI